MKRIYVVKIGSSILLTKRQKLDEYRIAQIADQITLLKEAQIGVVLVISGAVGIGSRYIVKKNDNRSRRLAAGIGQVILTSTFHSIFNRKGLQIGQILLTRKDLVQNNLIEILISYVEAGFVPVINENDVVELNSFHGNDFLGAEMAILLGIEKFIMLSTMKGSSFGVGGGKAKQEVIKILEKKHIQTNIVNGKVKNILLQTLL